MTAEPMILSLLKKPYPILLTAWFAAFVYGLIRTARDAEALSAIGSRMETAQKSLADKSRDLRAMARETEHRAKEMETLLGIINLLPQERGFARTQKVISDEVLNLRRKVSRWIGKDKVTIVVDTKANKLYLKQGLTLLMDADCSVGRGGILREDRKSTRLNSSH